MFQEPEGATPLDADDVEGLKFKHITTRLQLDELESANITAGLRWVGRRRTGDILTGEFARLLHKRLFGDVWIWAGTYRLIEKNIGIDPLQISVQVRILLDDARYWAEHSVFPPKEAAARFHHRMVRIHPFPNGNGRHARIAADIFLWDYFGHPPIEWASGVDLQADNERRSAYIHALRAADTGNMAPLFSFVGA
ncbi:MULTISPECIES: mobile mystery protein B [unclassified Rhizobium]|uniref:mobile mystery protein B n=1 Tax=unclassified Rhizobium TaxID=2613769 RepID=UPI000EA84A3D|nr:MULTISPECIES: mobile mystery protein B [unclassified Rhizobium]AYG67584.1 mobile mystery protein B [Rhizobium sp. CCGE531]AYG73978.1 mobile mystery protein B [Rhizobium sp. CCGE532]